MPAWKSQTKLILRDEDFLLHPFAGMYWENQNTLFVSDTHFGKISHFRKSGLAVPMAAVKQNWSRLIAMIEEFNPQKLVFLGDLFHSDYNKEWESFRMIGDTFHEMEMILVVGNHDILDLEHYRKASLKLVDTLEIGPFIFSHHPLEHKELYNIYGHIHPAVVMKGKGRQKLKLPCFYFGENSGIMPAFGSFTGTAIIPIKKGDNVFVITDDSVMRV